MEKITKKEMFGVLKSLMEGISTFPETVNKEMVVKFIDNEITLLEKKSNSTSKRSTKKQEQDDVIMTLILTELGNESLTVSQLLEKPLLVDFVTDSGNKLSNQKVSALLKKMGEKGFVEKVVDKRISYFSKNGNENVKAEVEKEEKAEEE